jgi:hypothetical protein
MVQERRRYLPLRLRVSLMEESLYNRLSYPLILFWSGVVSLFVKSAWIKRQIYRSNSRHNLLHCLIWLTVAIIEAVWIQMSPMEVVFLDLFGFLLPTMIGNQDPDLLSDSNLGQLHVISLISGSTFFPFAGGPLLGISATSLIFPLRQNIYICLSGSIVPREDLRIGESVVGLVMRRGARENQALSLSINSLSVI